MRWKFEFVAADLASTTLDAELASQLAEQLQKEAPTDAEGVDDLDLMHALTAQAATLAAMHKLSGEGGVEIMRTDAGGMVSVHHGEGAVVAQNADPAQVNKVVAARLALAAKLAPRKVVSPAPKATAPPAPRPR
jgi:hypothetical protein